MTQSQVFCYSSVKQTKTDRHRQKTKQEEVGTKESVNSGLEEMLLRIVSGRPQVGRG